MPLQTQTIKDAPLLRSTIINELHQDSLNTAHTAYSEHTERISPLSKTVMSVGDTKALYT